MPTSVRGKMLSQGSSLKAVEPISAEGARIIEGWANRPTLDRVREVIDAPSFSKAVEIFNQNPVMLYMHDTRRPIGKFTEVKALDEGLFVRGEIARGTPDSDTAWTLAQQGVLKAFSIGFSELDSTYDDQKVKHITDLELYEISVVSIPANREALFVVDGGKLLDILELPPEVPSAPDPAPAPTPPAASAAAPAAAGPSGEGAPAPTQVEPTAETAIDAPALLAQVLAGVQAELIERLAPLQAKLDDHSKTLVALLKREYRKVHDLAVANGIDPDGEETDPAPADEAGTTH